MQGVVMAGGQGTRLRPLTLTDPKPFLPVAGRPVVEWGILALKRAGITDVIVTTAYKKTVLQDRLGDGDHLGVDLRYAEEVVPLGTAGGVKNAEDLLEERFVVMSGDLVSDVDVAKLVAFHEAHAARATLGLLEVEDPTQFGIVGVEDDGAITRFKEKPTREEAFSNLISTGVYIVEREVLDDVPAGKPYDFAKDLFPGMVGGGLFGATIEGYWRDVGRPEDLIAANLEMARRKGQDRFGDVRVADRADVVDSVLMDGVRVAAGARVHDSLLLPGATVGEGSIVEHSVLGARTGVGRNARVTRSVLGTGEHVVDGERLDQVRRPQPEVTAQ